MGSEDAVGVDPPPRAGRRRFVTDGEGGTEAAHPSGQRSEGHPGLGRGLGCPRCLGPPLMLSAGAGYPALRWHQGCSTGRISTSKPPSPSSSSDGETHQVFLGWLLPITGSSITQQQLLGAPRSPAEALALSSSSTNHPRAPGRWPTWPSEQVFAGRAAFGGLSVLFFHYSALHYIL